MCLVCSEVYVYMYKYRTASTSFKPERLHIIVSTAVVSVKNCTMLV